MILKFTKSMMVLIAVLFAAGTSATEQAEVYFSDNIDKCAEGQGYNKQCLEYLNHRSIWYALQANPGPSPKQLFQGEIRKLKAEDNSAKDKASK